MCVATGSLSIAMQHASIALVPLPRTMLQNTHQKSTTPYNDCTVTVGCQGRRAKPKQLLQGCCLTVSDCCMAGIADVLHGVFWQEADQASLGSQ